MRIRGFVVVLALVGVLVPGLGGAEYPTGETMMKLEEGMTMEQLKGLLGTPDSVSTQPCLSRTGGAGQCRVWAYTGKGLLRVTLQKVGEGWVVTSWVSS